jgi:putative type-1 restriction enzyme hindVIIP specificity protein
MNKIKLKEIIEYQKGAVFKSQDYQKQGVGIVRVSDFEGNSINLDNIYYISNEIADKNKKVRLKPYDVVITTVGATAGNFIRVPIEADGYLLNQNTVRLRTKENNKWDQIYLFYALKYKNFQEFLRLGAQGSAQPSIVLDQILDAEIAYPDNRREIAKKLFSIDQKIQLNTQINQTLEQIAQALFKSWFVDFDPVRAKAQALSDSLSLEQAELAAMQAISGKTPEELTALSQTQPARYAELAETAKAFPCEMVEVDGVEVPKGWEYKPADELFDIGIGKTPPRKETEWFSTNPDDMQWISIKDMGNSGVFITESSEFLTNQAVDKFNIRKIPENTVLLSFKLTVGRVSITTCETTTNEAIAHFKITDKSFLTTEYLYLFFQQFDFNSLGSTSSIATAVNSKTIKGIEILIPNEELIKAFQMKISNIFAQIKNLTMENKNLVETRDLLLPKLLNEGIL